MTGLYVTLQLLVRTLHDRLDDAHTTALDERGSVTLEQVIITAALVLLAIGVGAAITVAVNRRLVGIN